MQTFNRWCATHERMLLFILLAAWSTLILVSYVLKGGFHMLILVGLSAVMALIFLLGSGVVLAVHWLSRKRRV
jgi:hypothetical protein